jgi:carbon-monoxide dehydrogenase small subunit
MNNLVYTLKVNGVEHKVRDAWVGESLLSVLRDRIGMYGTKGACEQGECGSCSVVVDGELLCSCLVLGASVVGADIITVEGLASDGAITDVQRAFVDHGAVQCGFCTPGLVVAVHDLLEANPEPTELEVKEALSGNICRCTGYGRIFAAVESVVELRKLADR